MKGGTKNVTPSYFCNHLTFSLSKRLAVLIPWKDEHGSHHTPLIFILICNLIPNWLTLFPSRKILNYRKRTVISTVSSMTNFPKNLYEVLMEKTWLTFHSSDGVAAAPGRTRAAAALLPWPASISVPQGLGGFLVGEKGRNCVKVLIPLLSPSAFTSSG